MSDWDFDLLGDPIPEGHGRRGRPAHMPTDENRRKVMLLAAFDKNEEQIAAALSITPPTLRKHYFRELRSRLEARHRLEGKLLSALVKEVDAGNVSAIDKLFKRLDRHDLATGAGMQRAKETKPAKKGKKESAIEQAHSAHEGSPWANLLKH
ncbi:hypothetical protein K3M67_03045 [Sphingobium sp. V4]|uniref:hypothetical protein n=1 Tax=Sphingobium sp. V4 TaxID=3038927 RepID=UPI0025581894|nr:hypothetical protein [Sphingobium sp. V4]WIW88973.1 hypothetical protein K3M67_03045 [Sphingobium sp. V4]